VADEILPGDWARAWATMSSIEFMGWMRDQGVTAPHVDLLGYRVVSYGEGSCELAWEVPRPLLNPAGIAHGGFLAAILDDASGMAASSAYPRWVPQLTVNLNVDYLAPVMPGWSIASSASWCGGVAPPCCPTRRSAIPTARCWPAPPACSNPIVRWSRATTGTRSACSLRDRAVGRGWLGSARTIVGDAGLPAAAPARDARGTSMPA
jgi:uncharacterized protein (TIGR00369 family)